MHGMRMCAAGAVHPEDREEEGPRGAHRRGGGPAAAGEPEHGLLQVHGLLHDAALHGGRDVGSRAPGKKSMQPATHRSNDLSTATTYVCV